MEMRINLRVLESLRKKNEKFSLSEGGQISALMQNRENIISTI